MCCSFVNILYLGLKFLQYALNILYFRNMWKKIDFLKPEHETTSFNRITLHFLSIHTILITILQRHFGVNLLYTLAKYNPKIFLINFLPINDKIWPESKCYGLSESIRLTMTFFMSNLIVNWSKCSRKLQMSLALHSVSHRLKKRPNIDSSPQNFKHILFGPRFLVNLSECEADCMKVTPSNFIVKSGSEKNMLTTFTFVSHTRRFL